MDDKLYYRELECYAKASESTIRMIGKKDYYDLSQLPSETMKCEFAHYTRKHGEQVSLNTIQHDKTYFNQCCEFFKTRRNLPDSMLDWEENSWVQLLKAWMLQNGISLTTKHTSVYGNTHMIDALLIRYLKRVIAFLQPEDLRPEQEKDIWHLEKLDIPISENPIYKTATLNFTAIRQDGIREEAKQAIYLHLKYEKLGTVKREMTSLRQFSRYLQAKNLPLQSCAEIDRALIEEYLIHKATDGSSGLYWKASGRFMDIRIWKCCLLTRISRQRLSRNLKLTPMES